MKRKGIDYDEQEEKILSHIFEISKEYRNF